MSARIGSLFSGYGGLDLGVQAVLGGEVAWHVEFDDAPSRILEHRFPGVPNYGDITATDWADVEPVDVLTGGFPCQDVSLAGLRRGLKDGTRSGLWSHFAVAIDKLRPQLVVIENVRGLLSAEADRGMESDPWAVGDGDRRPTLRALGAVLGDLAELRYDTRWCGVRAADAGAPHGRFRVFVVAHPSGEPWGFGDGDDVQARRETFRREPAAGRSGAAHSHSDGLGGVRRFVTGGRDVDRRGGSNGAGLASEPTASVEDAYLTARSEWGQSAPGQAPEWWARPDAGGRGRASAANAERSRIERRRAAGDVASAPRSGEGPVRSEQRDAAVDREHSALAWGAYEPAIRRWELATGRVAPAPTLADGSRGQHRLSSVFVEWMMGLPDGWVTDPAIGLSRNQQLKALGNGVVPQQAALAVATLLAAEVVAA